MNQEINNPVEHKQVSERETKLWWAVTDFGVKQVTGYSCAPVNPGMWWCPEAGFSASEGVQLFVHESDAIDKAIVGLEMIVSNAKKRIAELELRERELFLRAAPTQSIESIHSA